jgi:tetratricopeptide (TPR) repeat protein
MQSERTMNDEQHNDQIEGDDPNSLSQEELREIIDIRDRLSHAYCLDEPVRPDFRAYQRFLDSIYKYLKVDILDSGVPLLMSPYQQARSEYLIGKYYEAQKLFSMAAEHYQRGAEIAKQIPDWILYAQLKYLESKAFADHDPKPFRHIFATAVDALESWRRWRLRDVAEDIHFEFKLADHVGVSALAIADVDAAVAALDRAALLLLRLQGRPGADTQQYANDDLFLTWNWVVIYMLKGDYRRAFKHILLTRKKDRDLLKPINRGRLHWFIGVTALGCAEQGTVEDYTHGRLLAAAGRGIDEAYKFTKISKDRAGYALALLADAKLMGLLRKFKEKRVGKIAEAQSIAAELSDLVLLGHVDIAWGDEYAFQGKVEAAKRFYQKVVQDMTQLEFLQLVRVAEQRLARLANPSPPQSPDKDPAVSDSSPKKPNDPPPEDKTQYN